MRSTFGLFNELGPFLPPDNATGSWVLTDNPHSWNDRATMLFLDQPVGVGFSSFNKDALDPRQPGCIRGPCCSSPRVHWRV